MGLLDRVFGTYTREEREELAEWARHHDDPRAELGLRLFVQARDRWLTHAELWASWEQANRLVGSSRAPADYGEFVAYGYFTGRMDAESALVGLDRKRKAAR